MKQLLLYRMEDGAREFVHRIEVPMSTVVPQIVMHGGVTYLMRMDDNGRVFHYIAEEVHNA